LDCSLSDAIVVVGACAGKQVDLAKGVKVAREVGGRERTTIVGEVFLRDNAGVAAHKFEPLLCTQGFVRSQVGLELNVNHAAGMVHKDAAATILLSVGLFATGVEQAAFGGTHKVVYRGTLAGEELVTPEDVDAVADNAGDRARGRAAALLAKLARGTQRAIGGGELAGGSLDAPRALDVSEGTLTHEKLNAAVRNMAEALVPAQKLPLSIGQVGVRG
jgi:hypothetical protein